MVFSKEEKQIWQNSETMREFERLVAEQGDMLETPPEAYLPIKMAEDEDEKSWEDEGKLRDALEDFRHKDDEDETQLDPDEGILHEKKYFDTDMPPVGMKGEEDWESYKKDFLDHLKYLEDTEKEASLNMINNLTKLSSYMGTQGKVVEADKINKAINNIKFTLKEAQNGN